MCVGRGGHLSPHCSHLRVDTQALHSAYGGEVGRQFVFARVGQVLALTKESRLFLELFLAAPFGVSDSSASLAPSPGYMRQK